jgi:DNA-binding transcriptional ArsR family regulator
MTDARAVAEVAALLGDESRAEMLLAMLDGGCWTVSELADKASVGRAAASEHVARLAQGGLVETQTKGRHKYVRLAGPHVAELLERLGGFGEPAAPSSLSAVRERGRLAAARTCYDHLAGRLGVAVHDAMLEAGLLRRRGGLVVTPSGRDWLFERGIDLAELERSRRPLLRECVDLTERRPHLSGALGASLCSAFLDSDWVRRPDRTRALLLTPVGERALSDLLHITPGDLVVA